MLSQNDKIFFGEKIFRDCEIAVKYFGDDSQLNFGALISSKISEKPERNEKPAGNSFFKRSPKPANDEDSSHFIICAIFVS